jgi:hypothetical protein
MKLLPLLPLLFLISTSVAADNGNTYTCDSNGVCTETTTSIDGIKNTGSGIGSSVRSSVSGGNDLGKGRVNDGACDTEGNCEAGENSIVDGLGLLGINDFNQSGNAMEGINNTYTSQYSVDVSCNYAKSYTFTAGFAIRVENCFLDADNNVYALDAKVCHTMLSSEGCEASKEEFWSAPVTYTKTSQSWINNQNKVLDDKTSATISCLPQKRTCEMDITSKQELSGNMATLGDMALEGTADPNNYMSGLQVATRHQDDPTFQATVEGFGQEMADCASSNLFGYADEGYSLSCDGQHRVETSNTCTEVSTCLEEQTTLISLAKQCDTFVPTKTQVCNINIPWGSCEVFLESHQKTCDTITPGGTCIKDLVNAIKTCEISIPNGSCTSELETDSTACTYSVPSGSCNVEALFDTETCSATLPEGECNSTNSVTKTCSENVSATVECSLSAENEQSECVATPQYDTVICENTKNVTEQECKIERNAIETGEDKRDCKFDLDNPNSGVIEPIYTYGSEPDSCGIAIGCDWAIELRTLVNDCDIVVPGNYRENIDWSTNQNLLLSSVPPNTESRRVHVTATRTTNADGVTRAELCGYTNWLEFKDNRAGCNFYEYDDLLPGVDERAIEWSETDTCSAYTN